MTSSECPWCSPVRSGRTVRRGGEDRSWFGRPQAIKKAAGNAASKGTNASNVLASQRHHHLQAISGAVDAVYELPKKRSGIPIAPLGTESAARRDDAKRPPPSPMRWDCCGCRERFPRKDPGVFDLLGSSLSCDATGLTPPSKHLFLRDTELCVK